MLLVERSTVITRVQLSFFFKKNNNLYKWMGGVWLGFDNKLWCLHSKFCPRSSQLSASKLVTLNNFCPIGISLGARRITTKFSNIDTINPQLYFHHRIYQFLQKKIADCIRRTYKQPQRLLQKSSNCYLLSNSIFAFQIRSIEVNTWLLHKQKLTEVEVF